MPDEARVILTAFTLVVGSIAVYALRPGQTHRVGTWMWKGGASDPVRRVLFSPDGLPRRYAWLLATLCFGLFVSIIWFLPISD
jgi:hypothetical protein